MDSNEWDSPTFPPELEREIFETTAELYPETIRNPRLLLVSKRVHEWIERIKYRIVASTGAGSTCSFRLLRKAILDSNSNLPADFFYNRVQHLICEEGIHVDQDELPQILSACSGLQSLTLVAGVGPSILPILAVIKPRQVSISLGGLFGSPRSIDLSHPAFTRLTHLESFDNYCAFQDFPSSDVALLPALTHLALNGLSRSNVLVLLSSCPNIEVLIRVSHSPQDIVWEDLVPIDDARAVSMAFWGGPRTPGLGGPLDFWTRAELFIAKRRRGEIKPSSRCWIEDEDEI